MSWLISVILQPSLPCLQTVCFIYFQHCHYEMSSIVGESVKYGTSSSRQSNWSVNRMTYTYILCMYFLWVRLCGEWGCYLDKWVLVDGGTCQNGKIWFEVPSVQLVTKSDTKHLWLFSEGRYHLLQAHSMYRHVEVLHAFVTCSGEAGRSHQQHLTDIRFGTNQQFRLLLCTNKFRLT